MSADQPPELQRVGDAWQLKIEGFTEAGAVGAHIWPSGPPSSVRITAIIVVEEPAQVGLFELTGVTYESTETMEPSYAKWFFDNGLRSDASSEGRPLHTVRIWLNAFIPQAQVPGPPGFDCFHGDNRDFSSDPNAPARVHSEVVLGDLHTASPSMTQSHRCGLTSQVDCDTGSVVDSATASTEGLQFYNFRFPGAVVYDWSEPHPPPANPGQITVESSEPLSVDYVCAAANPLVPIAPFADLWAHIELDLATGWLTVNGAADDWPAFEGYVTVNEAHGPLWLFSLDGDDTPTALIGGANRQFSGSLSLGSYAAMG